MPVSAVHLMHIALVSTCESMVVTMQADIESPPAVGRVIRKVTCLDADVRLAYRAADAVALVVAAIAPTLSRVPRTQSRMRWPKPRGQLRVVENLDIRVSREMMVVDTKRQTILICTGHVTV